MFPWLREKFGKIAIFSIMGLIIFIFVFEGFMNPRGMRGVGEGSVAGQVNGEPIKYRDFARAYEQRVDFFKNMTGGKLTEAQITQFRIKEGVFSELVNRKLKAQAADKVGMAVSDEEVKARIREMDSFHKDGKFDLSQYRQLLAQNGYTEARFEGVMREDLSVQQWSNYFRNRVRVSDDEVAQEFVLSRDKRNIKYVLLTPQDIGPLAVTEADAKKYIADPANQTAVKGRYDARKETDYKGMPQADAELRVARELIAEKKPDDARKAAEKLADELSGVLTADKSSDAKVNALMKPYKIEVKSTGLISRTTRFIPGIGEAHDLMADAFNARSPIDPKDGGRAKKYNSASWWLVAVVSEAEKADLSKLQGERDKLMTQVALRKQRDLEDSWMKKIREKAKIETNPDVVGTRGGDAEG